MKVRSDKVTIGLNGERYAKGTVFECSDEDGNRLIKQGTVVRVDVPAPVPIETPKVIEPTTATPEVPEQEATIPTEEKPVEEEFKKVGGRWKRKPK